MALPTTSTRFTLEAIKMKHAIILTALFLGPSYASSQTFDLLLDHTTIVVSDLTESAIFYKHILQLKELETPWGQNAPVRFFSIGTDQQLHVAQINNVAIEPSKVIHLAFNVQDFDAYLEFLIGKGIEYSNFAGDSVQPQIRPDGVKQIYLQAPDGNWIEINNSQY